MRLGELAYPMIDAAARTLPEASDTPSSSKTVKVKVWRVLDLLNDKDNPGDLWQRWRDLLASDPEYSLSFHERVFWAEASKRPERAS